MQRQRRSAKNSFIFPSNPETGEIGSINFNICLAQAVGLPIIGLRNESLLLSTVLLLYCVPAFSLLTCCYVIFELHDLLLNWRSLNVVTQNICLSLTRLAGIYKMLNTIYRLSEVKMVLQRLRNITKCFIVTERQMATFSSEEFRNKVMLMVFGSIILMTGILSNGFLYYNPATVAGQIFPFRVRLPNLLPPKLQVFYMGTSVLMSALQIVANDYLNMNLMNQICLHLKIINLTFEEFNFEKEDNMESEKVDLALIDANRRLHNIVNYHVELRALREKVDDIFSIPVIIQFATSLIVFAMTGFQAIVQPGGSIGAILIYFYCGCTFSQLFLYCWFGNEVYEQSKTLASTGFNSNWYNYDRPFRKSLLVFMTNAQKPMLFTAGRFMDLSLPSFAYILSKSYSFIAVLRQVYGRQ